MRKYQMTLMLSYETGVRGFGLYISVYSQSILHRISNTTENIFHYQKHPAVDYQNIN